MVHSQSMILLFHSVLEPSKLNNRFIDRPRLEMSTLQFQHIIAQLKAKDYQFISLNELYERLNLQDKELMKHSFISVTFDDGFANNYMYAYPILMEHQIPFTLYVTTGYPDQEIIHVSEAIEDLVRNNHQLRFEWNGNSYVYDLSTLANKKQAMLQIEQQCKALRLDIQDIVELLKINPVQYRQCGLTWGQINEMNNSPLCTIGAHTRTHPDLTVMNQLELRSELIEPKARLEEMIGEEVVHLAYPYGRYSESVRKAAIEAGYKMITTTQSGNVPITNVDMFALPRIYCTANMEV
ncbi:polysaccharide deacetylase family protein [Paenibacillus alvei]|uniref:polysaccharide deacetylase family protein n=1 Tax=Paenibacillus alvei TaxID=44250 RepID=UPI0003863D6F|nr:polysaccharide deacetylase family protein [Paenibacillus alvei]EPY13407.1 polysaccharide deacetylase [Paenibacillus alvei A6-6i-x]